MVKPRGPSSTKPPPDDRRPPWPLQSGLSSRGNVREGAAIEKRKGVWRKGNWYGSRRRYSDGSQIHFPDLSM